MVVKIQSVSQMKFCFPLSHFSGEEFLLMCVLLLLLLWCAMLFFFSFRPFLFFFRLTHLSGKQNCLFPVGGRNSHLEIKKKTPPTSHVQLPFGIFVCLFFGCKLGKKGKMKWMWNCSFSFTHQQASINTQVTRKSWARLADWCAACISQQTLHTWLFSRCRGGFHKCLNNNNLINSTYVQSTLSLPPNNRNSSFFYL